VFAKSLENYRITIYNIYFLGGSIQLHNYLHFEKMFVPESLQYWSVIIFYKHFVPKKSFLLRVNSKFSIDIITWKNI